jgi:phospholipase/lecithinase/hemolysin
MLRSVILAGLIAVSSACAASASTLTDKYTSFWVFGDGYSDNGNLFAATGGAAPASPPYFNGRFSNGPVWNEGIGADFAFAGASSANFAFGGATAVTNGDPIPDLLLQIGLFNATVPPVAQGTRPLASLWFGANDILNAIDGAVGESATLAAAIAAANAVGLGVLSLKALGIEDFAVWNLPDLGAAPRFAAQPSNAQLASDATDAFNARLDIVLADLRGDGLQVNEIDTFSLFAAVVDDPAAFGFDDATTSCLVSGPSVCANPTGLFYFDPIHPTAAAHALLEDTFEDTFVAAVPLPSSGLLLSVGLGLLASARSRFVRRSFQPSAAAVG